MPFWLVRAFICTLSLLVILPWAGGCGGTGDGPQPVVVYVSADESIARPIIKAFEDRTGQRVLPVFDTEATKTTGLASRLVAERERPRADLFWSSECFRTIALAEDGLLAPMTGEVFDEWMADRPGLWRDPSGAWFAFAPRARVLVHRPVEDGADPPPSTWAALAEPRWSGRIAMADPRFGTTSGHLGAMASFWTAEGHPDHYATWVDGLVRNRVGILTTGNAGVVDAVAAGEYDLGMTDTDDVWAARERGLEVELIYPRHADPERPDGGTLLIPNTVARVAGGPNPEGARAFAEWLLSPEVERMLAESSSHNVPLRTDPGPWAVPDPLDVDLVDASRRMGDSIRLLRARLAEGADE